MIDNSQFDKPGDDADGGRSVMPATSSGAMDWLLPNQRRIAIVFFITSIVSVAMGLLLAAGSHWQASTALAETHGNPFYSFLGWPSDASDDVTRRAMIALLIHFGACGLIFGCFGNLLTPLQSGAGSRAVAWPGRLAVSAFVAGFVLFLVSIPLDNAGVRALFAAGCLWSFSLFMVAFAIIFTVRGRRCKGMTIDRLPLSTWSFYIASYPMLAIVLGFVITAVVAIWRPTFTFDLAGERTFWSTTAPVYLGLALVVSVLQIFDIGAVLSRSRLRFGLDRGTTIFAVYALFALAVSLIFAATTGASASNIIARLIVAAIIVLTFIHLTGIRPSTFGKYAVSPFAERAPFFFLVAIIWCFGRSLFAKKPILVLSADGWQEGESLVAILGLFTLCASASIYFWYPRLVRRNLNQTIGRVHFAATMWALLVLLIGPAFFADVDRIRAVGVATLMAAQFPLLVNVFASTFKFGNRVYLYPAILIIIELIARWLFGLDHGLLGWIWISLPAHWIISLILTLIVVVVMALIDRGLQIAFPPKRKHPRPNRWICIAALMTTWPLVFAPILLTSTGLPISVGVGWALTILSSALGLAFAFKRGNRLTFADDVVDNPWRANSLEWYERAPGIAIESFPSDVEVFRGPYEFTTPGDSQAADHLAQWRRSEASTDSA